MYLEITSKSKRGFRFFSPSFGLAAIRLLNHLNIKSRKKSILSMFMFLSYVHDIAFTS